MSHPVSREIPIEPEHTRAAVRRRAELQLHRDGGEYAHLSAADKEQRYGYFFRTLKARALPNMVRLQRPAAVRASR